jgi:hypothetical protein
MSPTAKILDRMTSRNNDDVVWGVPDFLDLGRYDAVARALSRLAKAGKLRRAGHGLYYLTSWNNLLGDYVMPSVDAVVRAIARRTDAKVMPWGGLMANMAGLNDDVPARYVYLTDGSPRKVKIGNNTVQLRRAAPRTMAWYDRPAAPFALGLRWLGPSAADNSRVRTTLKRLPAPVKGDLLNGANLLPSWAGRLVRECTLSDPHERTA